MADADKSPVEDLVEQMIEQALDVFVYAPLGLALVARDQLPSLVERGRKQVAQQTNLARMMGQYAAKEGEKKIRKRVEDLRAQPAPPAATPDASAPGGATDPNRNTGEPARSGEPTAPAAPKPSGDHLAIPGYDTLSASQVVQRLAGLQRDELEAVQAYEEATRGRRTILTKIAQLQATPPA